MEPYPPLDFFIVNVVPLFSFFGGVLIADLTGLYENLARRHMWLISIPTGLLTTGLLITSAASTVEEKVYHGYTGSFAEYVVFCAIIVFYGTAAPELFASFRARITRINN